MLPKGGYLLPITKFLAWFSPSLFNRSCKSLTGERRFEHRSWFCSKKNLLHILGQIEGVRILSQKQTAKLKDKTQSYRRFSVLGEYERLEHARPIPNVVVLIVLCQCENISHQQQGLHWIDNEQFSCQIQDLQAKQKIILFKNVHKNRLKNPT